MVPLAIDHSIVKSIIFQVAGRKYFNPMDYRYDCIVVALMGLFV